MVGVFVCLPVLLGAECIPRPVDENPWSSDAVPIDLTGDPNCIIPPIHSAGNQSDGFARVILVSNEAELQNAVSGAEESTLIVLQPGTYQLTRSLFIRKNNVTLRGDSTRCDEVVLAGPGMDDEAGRSSVPHGVWSDASNLGVENLTIRDVWFHGIALNAGATAPKISNVRIVDTGQQMLKASDTGSGPAINEGLVEYSVFEYTNGPTRIDHGGGTGYTNGVDVHGGSNWVIRGNRFENFHTPDDSDRRWNPAILMWNGASETVVDGNVFLDVDRAIALGLIDRDEDHRGGVVSNNMIVTSQNLFSSQRRASSDAAILIWDSAGTEVVHNSILTQGNQRLSIELRFDSGGVRVANNLVDAPISDRSSNSYEAFGNIDNVDSTVFSDVGRGDLHLAAEPAVEMATGAPLGSTLLDVDGEVRPADGTAVIGADQPSR